MPTTRFAIREALADLPVTVSATVAENPILSAPTFRALVEAADGKLVLGSESLDGPRVTWL